MAANIDALEIIEKSLLARKLHEIAAKTGIKGGLMSHIRKHTLAAAALAFGMALGGFGASASA